MTGEALTDARDLLHRPVNIPDTAGKPLSTVSALIVTRVDVTHSDHQASTIAVGERCDVTPKLVPVHPRGPGTVLEVYPGVLVQPGAD